VASSICLRATIFQNPEWILWTHCIYSAYNHKRATAAKCRESNQRRTDATTAVPFPESGGVTRGILRRWRAYDCTHCILLLFILTADGFLRCGNDTAHTLHTK
jgi:hypothetical protein